MGCGLHGAGWNLSQIFRNDASQVIALCNVDEAQNIGPKLIESCHTLRRTEIECELTVGSFDRSHMKLRINTIGHVLEWLALSLTDAQLQAP